MQLISIRQTSGRAFERLLALVSRTYSAIYRLKNRRAPSLLIYTDSRGFEITRRFNRRSIFGTYIEPLVKDYSATVIVFPKPHTTLVDFLTAYEALTKRGRHFDAIILHAGIVDFSPRPLPSIKKLYATKRQELERYFTPEEMDANLKEDTGFTYEGEPTRYLLSKPMALKLARNHLSRIPNLIWIGCNPIVPCWRGSYWKDRPADMPVVGEYSRLYADTLEHVIDLQSWDETQVKHYTSDNVHLSTEGFRHLTSLIHSKLDEFGLRPTR